MIGAKPMRIRFDRLHGFIRVYDGTRYLKLSEIGKYHETFNRIRYLTEVESCITYIILFYMQKSKLIHTILCL